MSLSARQLDAFANPAKAVCREGNRRVRREAAYLRWEQIVTMTEGREV